MSDTFVMMSPIGPLGIRTDRDGLCAVAFRPAGEPAARPERHGLLRLVSDQIEAYFAGELTQFTLPLSMRGTAFRRAVWTALLEIPYGETRSYGDIAAHIGSGTSPRAVGAANGRNPISIVVPCHRVIGADGGLVGYSGGLDTKRRLLDLEARMLMERAARGAVPPVLSHTS